MLTSLDNQSVPLGSQLDVDTCSCRTAIMDNTSSSWALCFSWLRRQGMSFGKYCDEKIQVVSEGVLVRCSAPLFS